MPDNKLTTFLTHISIEPKNSISFNKNPAAHINASALSATDKQAVLSKNPTIIRDAILKERGIQPGGVNAAGDTEVVLVIVI